MKILSKISISFCILILASLFSHAQKQNFRFEHFSVKDGLSQVCVNSIIQDEKGFIWLATNDGLNRFDGYNFTVYKPNVGDQTSLSNNVVKTVYEDREGDIWIGTAGGGLCLYNPEKDDFTAYNLNDSTVVAKGSNDVYALFEDTDSVLWVGTFGGGLKRFDKKTGKIKHYMYNPADSQSISSNSIRAITEDRDGYLWVGLDGGGLNRMHKIGETFKKYNHTEGNNSSLPSDNVMHLLYDEQKDVLWIGTYGGGLSKLDLNYDRFKNFNTANESGISNDIVWVVEKTGSSNLVIGTRGGGFDLFNTEKETFYNVRSYPFDPHSLSDNAVISICVDRNSVWWIGTENGGVNKFAASQKKFDVYQPANKLSQKAEQNNVYSVAIQKDNIIVGTRGGGLITFDQDFYNISQYETDKELSFDFSDVNVFTEDPQDGSLWAGTDGNGLFHLTADFKAIENYRFISGDSNSLSNNAIKSLLFDDNGLLWIGTFGGGLNRFDKKARKFDNFPIDSHNKMRNVVLTLYEDSQKRLWVGTNGHGLMLFDRKKLQFSSFQNNRNDLKSISNNVVYALHEDEAGYLWVGTGGGLNMFDSEKESFIVYNQQVGLANDMVIGILQDKNHNLWLSTYNGLSKFNLVTKTFQNYYDTDGLPSNTFNEGACFKNKNGKLFFGTANGLIAFFPDSIVHSDYEPTIYLTDFKVYNQSIGIGESVNGKVLYDKSIFFVDKIDLSYKHNVISFEFAALDFASPDKIQYQYMMQNFDTQWNTTNSDNRIATYTNLPGGTYVFKVRSTNSDGVLTDNTLNVVVNVDPPFWKTSWFYSLAVIFIIISIYVYVKYREHLHIVEKNKLELQVRERTQEINMQKEELQRQSELLEEKNTDLTRTNLLLNDSIDYAKRIQDAMLPDIEVIKKTLPECFVYYHPRDKVSGDFYWFYEQNEKLFLVAADCTGHGVPGAFMSMIGSTLLNEIVIEKQEKVPSEILKLLNAGVIKALNQNTARNQSQDDGMDISICCIDRKQNRIEIACANHTVYLIYQDTLNVIQGDIFSIGGIFSLKENRDFTNHVFELKSGTTLYMFSDGFQDQFGGARNKKFMANRFRDLLFKQHGVLMAEQEQMLDETFNQWKGKNRQVDDVLIMGVRL